MDKNKKSDKTENQDKNQDSVMIKPREIIPIMAQSSDPMGSYTGIPEGGVSGALDKTPVQDADDL